MTNPPEIAIYNLSKQEEARILLGTGDFLKVSEQNRATVLNE